MADPTQTAAAPVTTSTAQGNPLPASAQASLSQGGAPIQAAPVAAQAAAPPAPAQATAASPAVPVNPKAPHANLVNMIQNLALGVDSFARAAATHGREGGVGEVQDYYARQQQQAIQKQQATQEQQEFDLRQKAQNANLLIQQMTYQHAMMRFPTELKEDQLALQNDTIAEFTKEKQTGESMGYDMNDPAQAQEAKLRMGIGPAAEQPGAIVVPFTSGQKTQDVTQALTSALPSGASLTDYAVLPTYQDGKHGTGGSVTLVPNTSPIMQMPATPRQIASSQAEVEGMLTQGKALGLTDNDMFKRLDGQYQNIKQVLDNGGKPTTAQLFQMHMSVAGPLSKLVADTSQANKFSQESAEASGAALKTQQEQQLHQAYLASGSKLPEADWTAVNKTTLTSNAENRSRLDYAPAIAGAEETARQNASNKPVYAINPSGDTVLTTYLTASNGGMHGIRQVSEADISKDQHDVKVLSDIQSKANNVAQAAGAMDSNSWTQAAIAAKVLADNPNTTVNTLFKSSALKNATPQTRAYVIAINSLRESSMGLQKVLTGSARSNETQMAALLNTLPGVEPDAGTVTQKLGAFTQNLNLLAQGLPKGTGVELQGFGGPATPQTHSFSASTWQKANPNGDVNAAIAQARQQNYTVVQ